MPSSSGKQHRYMEMIAHGGKPRKGGGPSPEVAREFVEADKEVGAFRSSVKKRSDKIRNRRKK